jgi:hypothetical protein
MARKSNGRESGTAAGGDRIEGFAEDLGRLLGSAQNKAESWLSQRSDIAKHLENVRDTAIDLLNQLGVPGAGASRGRSGRKSRRASGGTRRKRTMSPEARERIAAAQRKRWAKVRKAKGE